MKTLIASVLLAFALPVHAASDAQALLQQAQDAYVKGDHQRALALYDSVNTRETSAGLLFNIGNCWSKLGDVPHAILYYERALRLDPGAEDIQANLDLERAKVVDRMNQPPSFTLSSLWDRLVSGTDMDQWARRSLWACALMAMAAGAAIWMQGVMAKRLLTAVAAIALVATVVSTLLAAYRVNQVNSRSEAIIMAPSADILGEPRDGATRLFILHQGTKVGALQQQGEWYEVRLASGAVGWLPAKAIEVI
jgi:tetratricopeptide (TPR) repeat protein